MPFAICSSARCAFSQKWGSGSYTPARVCPLCRSAVLTACPKCRAAIEDAQGPSCRGCGGALKV